MGDHELTAAARGQLEHLRSEPFRRLWSRARALIERRDGDLTGGTLGLRDTSDAEWLAIAGLLGRPRAGGAVMHVRLADLDAVLRAGALGVGLIDVLPLVGAPLRDRAREADALERAIAAAVESAGASRLSSEPWFASWLDALRADGSLRRLVAEGQSDLIGAALRTFETLPAEGVPLPVLASRIAGTTKALGPGALSTIVLRGLALRAGTARPTNAAERRALWETFGVVADDLSSDVLVLNLPARGSTRLDDWLRGAREDGVPLRVTLHQLSKYRFAVEPTRVWICENPAVLRAASQRFGGASAAMVCSEGQPSTAFDILIDALTRNECELWYHGDFDWAGVRIAAAIRARHGAAMWRMTADDYREAVASLDEAELPDLVGAEATAPWDPSLVPAMMGAGRAVFEESVLDTLLTDLETSPRAAPPRHAATSVRELVALTRCAHRVHLDRHGDPEQRTPTSAFLELVWNAAASRADEALADGEVIHVDRDRPFEARRARTLELMRAGAARIAGAVLAAGDLSGEVPLLVRRATPPQKYVAAVVWSASSREASVPTRDALALCGFSELLEEVQGWRPPVGLILDADGEREIDLEAFRPEYRALRRRMRTLRLDVEVSAPGLKAACRLCRWRVHCHDELTRLDDLTLVPGIGEAERDRLRGAGVTTRERLTETSPEALESIVGKRRSQQFVRAARVQRTGVPETLRAWAPPDVDLEIAYDLEDDPLRSQVYLHGVLVRPQGARRFGATGFGEQDYGAYEAVCAWRSETEREVWCRFVDRVRRLLDGPTFCVYVFGAHERTTLQRLARRHGGGDVVDPFIARFIDLHTALSSTVVLPTESMSLKAIARWIGFRWRDADPSGAESAAWWADYVSSPEERVASRDRVIVYNEDDVRATMVIADWLRALGAPP